MSVGNLSAGGSGKTVLCDWLLHRFPGAGLAARGYGAERGQPNDEMKLLASHHPGLLMESDPDRVAGARRLKERGARWVLLDDGFQHRRLRRDLDLVLLDAVNPFAGGLLPAGNLREPPSALHRADLIILSRADALDSASREGLRRELSLRFGKTVLCARHVPRPPRLHGNGTVLEPGEVHMLAGVAHPSSVAASLAKLGYWVKERTCPGDHRKPSAWDLKRLEQTKLPIVCTEKDWVKAPPGAAWHVLKVEWEFMDKSNTLDRLMERALGAPR